jgi:uncharacterized membrane protein
MFNPGLHYFPLEQSFLLVLVFLVAFLIAFIQIGVLGYAYERMGIHPKYIYALLILSLLGSYVNIPVAELNAAEIVPAQVVSFFGMHYVIPPTVDVHRTIIAVNLGGAVIPTLLSLYLLFRNQLFVEGLLAVVIVAVIVHLLAYPVRGLGIAVPTLVPPILAAIVALLLSRRNAAPLAYICGSLGTLIGADLLNLDLLPALGAPVASIGGAGTFDGIFLSGILAVVLAAAFSPRRSAR